MEGSLKIKQKSLNLTLFVTKKVKEIEKAIEGIYIDSPLNRKLGRVGMSYKKGDTNKEGEDSENKKEKFTKINKVLSESKILNDLSTKELIYVSKELNLPMNGSDNDKKQRIVDKFLKSKGNSLRGNNKDKINGFNEYLKYAKENANQSIKINDIVNLSKTLKNAQGDRLNAIINYAELKVDKNADDVTKRQKIANSYIESAELSGSNEEIANSLDEIVEDALADYVPPKKEG